MKRLLAIIGVCAAIAIALAACGSNDNGLSSSSGSSSLSTPSYSEQDLFQFVCMKDNKVVWKSQKYRQDIFDSPDGQMINYSMDGTAMAYHIPPGVFCEEQHTKKRVMDK